MYRFLIKHYWKSWEWHEKRWRENLQLTAWTYGTLYLSPFHRLTMLTQRGPACWGLPALRSWRIPISSELGRKSSGSAESSELFHGTLWLHDAICQTEAAAFITPGNKEAVQDQKVIKKMTEALFWAYVAFILEKNLLSDHFLRFTIVARCWPKEMIPISILIAVPSQLYFPSTSKRNLLPGLIAAVWVQDAFVWAKLILKTRSSCPKILVRESDYLRHIL